MYCRSFRDDDILKCPEQFCSLYISRTYTKESYVAEDNTGMVELANTTILPFGAFLLSECGVITIWLHPGCIFRYETRGMLDAGYLRWYFGSFSLACDASRMPSLAAPPLGGDLALSPSRLRSRLRD